MSLVRLHNKVFIVTRKAAWARVWCKYLVDKPGFEIDLEDGLICRFWPDYLSVLKLLQAEAYIQIDLGIFYEIPYPAVTALFCCAVGASFWSGFSESSTSKKEEKKEEKAAKEAEKEKEKEGDGVCEDPG